MSYLEKDVSLFTLTEIWELSYDIHFPLPQPKMPHDWSLVWFRFSLLVSLISCGLSRHPRMQLSEILALVLFAIKFLFLSSLIRLPGIKIKFTSQVKLKLDL